MSFIELTVSTKGGATRRMAFNTTHVTAVVEMEDHTARVTVTHTGDELGVQSVHQSYDQVMRLVREAERENRTRFVRTIERLTGD